MLAVCAASCQSTPEETAMQTLQTALEELNAGNHDAYLQHVDFGTDMEAAQLTYMKDALRQHVGWRQSERAAITSIDMVKAQMQDDSVCTVYYQYSFADGVREVSAQKMVRHGGKWKIRLRN